MPTAALVAALLWPAPAGAGDGLTCRSKLDLICSEPRRPDRLIVVREAEPRFQGNAVTVRFGGEKKKGEPSLDVQIGSWLQRALFIAAVVTTFIL